MLSADLILYICNVLVTQYREHVYIYAMIMLYRNEVLLQTEKDFVLNSFRIVSSFSVEYNSLAVKESDCQLRTFGVISFTVFPSLGGVLDISRCNVHVYLAGDSGEYLCVNILHSTIVIQRTQDCLIEHVY